MCARVNVSEGRAARDDLAGALVPGRVRPLDQATNRRHLTA
jgi:hypothetical protein